MHTDTLILGAGIAGLCSALALSRKGVPVTLIDRDTPPPDADPDTVFAKWPRRGACQFRHPHAFLGLMCNLIEERYPDLMEAFYAAGARRMDLEQMLPGPLASKYRPEPGDEKIFVLLCRRVVIETVLRRYVATQPGVTMVNGVHIDGVLTEQRDGALVATGVTVRRDCTEVLGETITCDTLVDAGGRTTKFPRWFAAEGVDVDEENDDAEIVYWTRHYRLKRGQQEPPRDPDNPSSGDLGYIKYGTFPGDNGNFAVIVCLHMVEEQLRKGIQRGAGFDAVARRIPGLAPWVDPARSEPVTEPFGIGDIRAVWRHWLADGQPLVRNYFAVGDAALRTNPLYGRGCSTGILHAHILADVLAANDDPVARAMELDRRTTEELRPIFEASRSEDRNGIRRSLAHARGESVERPAKGFQAWFGAAFGDALAAAAKHNLHVLRGMLRTVNLLEKPGAFLAERKTKWIIFAYMLRGRSRNAAERVVRGPAREEMLEAVTGGQA